MLLIAVSTLRLPIKKSKKIQLKDKELLFLKRTLPVVNLML